MAASVTATALILAGVLTAAPAQAAETTIDNAVFRWGISNEANSGAFAPGTYNLLSAGEVSATSANDRVTETNWKQSEGNVRILKLQSDSTYAAADFAGLRTNAAGTVITAGNGLNSGHVAEITAGTGTVDPAAGTAEIQWTGTFTSAFYSGMTRSWITNPRLSVAANGTGTVTATLGGYETSMDDPSAFASITPVQNVVIASLTGVQVSATGFTVTPDYLGKTVDVRGGSAQVTTGANAGAFPQSFVDFQTRTGQQSYWYSSGGAADARKPATPLSVSYSAAAQPAAPAVTVSKTSGLTRAGETVTVTGSGFLPSGAATNGARPPLAGKFTGAYVVFGKFADKWQPSTGAAGATRAVIAQKWAVPAESIATVGGANAGAIELNSDGTFSVEITLTASDANDLKVGNYGIYTYPGGGSTFAPFETFTPVSFAAAPNDVIVDVPAWVEAPTGSFGWAFAGTAPANLGTATQSGSTFIASGSLTNIVVTDTRSGGSTPYTWSISGQASAFTSTGGGSFSGGLMGWTPKVVQGDATVTAGSAVTSTQLGGTGLDSSRVLASSTTAATATIGADLALVIPGGTAAGAYTSKLTITALQ